MSENDHDDLMIRYREGDETACRLLVEQQMASLRRRLAPRIPVSLRRRISVSDVIQEACVVAFRRRADFEARGPNAFRNWLAGIADRKLRDAVRFHGRAARRAAVREVTRRERPDTALFAASRGSPSAAAMSAEARAAVHAALDRLPTDYAQVLRLAFTEGLNLREAAERMGRSHDATRKLYGRALCRLRDLITESQGEGA